MTTLQKVFQCDHPVALITGSGAPRVGRAIAKHLASLGCRIALHAHSSDQQLEQAAAEIQQAYGVEVTQTRGALDQEPIADQIIHQVCNAFQRIDILVNSAAIWAPSKLEEITAEELRRYFDVNTLGSFLCARAAGLVMASQPAGGSIVNLGDWATVRPYQDHAAYFPSKGAVEVMTRSLAVELAQRNHQVRVNCIQPGPVLLGEDVTPQHRQKIAASTLVGRVGRPEHVSHTVQFLCENDFLTGVCIPVDGGRSIYAPDDLQVGLNTG